MADVMKDTIRRRCPGCFCIWGGTILATPREGGVLCSMVNACLCFCIFYMDMGLSAPQANGHPIFAIQEKALQAQGAMPRVVCKATHLVSPDTAKSGISPNLDRDKMFNELWWLHYCFCDGIGICGGYLLFGGEAATLCRHSRCEINDVGDPLCYGICFCLCIDKLLKVLWWLNYSLCEGIGIGAIGNLFFGGEAANICCHSRYEMTDVEVPFCSSISICPYVADQCFLPLVRDLPFAVASTKCWQEMIDQPQGALRN